MSTTYKELIIICTIKENESKIGYGSWHVTQSYLDYQDTLTFEQYRSYIYSKCIQRIKSFKLIHGDIIQFEYIGGSKVRKIKGEFLSIHGDLHIQQKTRQLSFPLTLIDDIQILERIDNHKTIRLSDIQKRRDLH